MAKLGVLNEVYFKLRGREFSRKCLLKNIKFRAHTSISSELLSFICFTPSLLQTSKTSLAPNLLPSTCLLPTVTREVPMLRWARPPLRLRFRLLRSKPGLRCRPSLLSRETSLSPSREGAGSSRRRVPVLFCTGHCSGSWDRGRNSARYGNSRRLGRSRCFGLTCWIVHDFDSRRR